MLTLSYHSSSKSLDKERIFSLGLGYKFEATKLLSDERYFAAQLNNEMRDGQATG